jgi:CheY-like chemotaxis protein
MSRVLVVDDEVEICLLVTQYFKKLGYETSFCLSIAEAAEKLAAEAYDLLFVDLNLRIKALHQSQSTTKVIVISAYDSERQKALQRGASFFIAKPFTKKSIDDSLQKINFLTK